MSDRSDDIPLHAVLVRPEIPHNTGAIGRTCVALGCDLGLVRPLGFALSDEYVRRAGLDYWQHRLLVVYDNCSCFVHGLWFYHRFLCGRSVFIIDFCVDRSVGIA